MTAAEIAAERFELLRQLEDRSHRASDARRACDFDICRGWYEECARLAKLLELNANQKAGECS